MKITDRVLENYLNCSYKAFLALEGETGTPETAMLLAPALGVEDNGHV